MGRLSETLLQTMKGASFSGPYNKRTVQSYGQLDTEHIMQILPFGQAVGPSPLMSVFQYLPYLSLSLQLRQTLMQTVLLARWSGMWVTAIFIQCCCLILQIQRSLKSAKRWQIEWQDQLLH